jgi:electron transfer flavoprotein beta subunit
VWFLSAAIFTVTKEVSFLNIIVCAKQILDPEAPPASFKIDAAANSVIPPAGIAPVISPFDEQAVEAALKIKDAHGGKVTVISLGTNLLRDVVKKPLSMGADELVLLEDPAFAGGDSWSIANALAMAIRKIGTFDMIICGRQAADWDAGQVGLGIAEILDLPSVITARKITVSPGKARVEKVVPNGYEVIETPLPALITVSNEIGEPRYPTIKGIMAAKKKEPIVWKTTDIGITPDKVGSAGRRVKLIKLFQPQRGGKCEIIAGDTPEEAATKLALRLREAKIL